MGHNGKEHGNYHNGLYGDCGLYGVIYEEIAQLVTVQGNAGWGARAAWRHFSRMQFWCLARGGPQVIVATAIGVRH